MTSQERVESTQIYSRQPQSTRRDRDRLPITSRERDDSLSSNDWVSPFTLPPLPALRRGRDQVDLLKSPDQSRQRGSSGTYYAAAWGSPYASPSPDSATRNRARRNSLDAEFQSPPRFGQLPLARGSALARHSISDILASPESRPQPQRVNSERPNWLSDSDDSEIEGSQPGYLTPKSNAELASWGPSPALDRSSPRSHQTHGTQESTDTVTPETFSAVRARRGVRGAAQSFTMAQTEEPSSELSPDLEIVKPLPSLPENDVQDTPVAARSEVQSSPSRPRIGSLSSFHRQRRKVVWKGKNCIISLPMTDRESAGLPSMMSPSEVKEKLAELRSKGYSTNGFELTDVDGTSATLSNGQSCPAFPDPGEISSERQMRSFKVYIPDQSEWQKWVEYLQEEKLRALGVTSSDSEIVPSGPSPLSASLSRTSSRLPGAISPTVGTSSGAANPTRITSNPISSPFSTTSSRGSALGSGASSQLNGFAGSMHGYKGSLAFLPGQGRIVSPGEFVPGQTSPFVPGLNAHLRRPTSLSPINAHGIQSLNQVLSPANGPLGGRSLPGQSQGSYFPNEASDHAASRGQEPTSSSLSPPVLSQASAGAPRTPTFAHTPRPGPEIQHPTPRSHRHNLSAALQKEIDEAEAALAKQDLEDSADGEKALGAKAAPMSAQFEEDHEEPPILRRPETMEGTDDQSDIITNPSLAGTPALTRDAHPFNTWQALSDAARDDKKQESTGHAAKLSQTKLNVEAKEFNPSAGFNSSNFNFGTTNAFKPSDAPFKPSAQALKPSPAQAAKPSLSQFNIEAPTFVPGGTTKAAGPLTKSTLPQQSPFAFSSATFNVDTPMSKGRKSSITQSSPFAISSSPFNVDAPVFNPGSSFATGLASNSTPAAGENKPSEASIFGKVSIEPGSQAVRRNKALPIVRPRSKDGPGRSSSSSSSSGTSTSGSENEDEEEEDGSDGRAPVPTDRAKRAKTVDSDGDRSPVYADSAPFRGNSRILSEIINERQVSPEKSKEKPVDGYSYIAAESKSASASSSPSPSQQKIASGRTSPYQFMDERDAIKFSEARPRSQGDESGIDTPADLPSSPGRDLSLSSEPEDSLRSSLSALATPFVYKPAQSVASAPRTPAMQPSIDTPTSTASQPAKRKVSGLMASRYAKPPSPELPSSPPLVAQEKESSPQISDHALQTSINDNVSRDMKLSQNLDDTATSDIDEPVQHSPMKHSAALSQEVRTETNPSEASPIVALQHDRLASLASSRYAPQNAQNLSLSSSKYGAKYDTASLASPAYVPGRKELPEVEFSDDDDDLMPSFEEIDAVMKQFETNPELGIERHDSPVQSTPLVDMRLGNNFRSDAPSPSPRRVDRPIEPTQAANAASFGLGLGIHRLNSGKEEVSDWNDIISSTEEDKLQSRAQFFDGHVNDLVDGLLENRLGPVERTLQTIQQSLSLLATRPSSKRKSTSSDVRESDADDEDEYDAYEGFTAYRSRSPDAKRNRHTSRVRAAVAEGLAQFRESIPQQQAQTVDLSELRDELAEIRELTQERVETANLKAEIAEMRQLLEKQAGTVQQKDLKRTLEDVIGSHPRLRGSRTEQDHGSSSGNFKLQLDGLEAMLKVEQERAEHEARLRKQREEEVHELRQKLQEAEDEVAGQREANEMAEQNLQAFVQEKEAYKSSEREVHRLNLMVDEQEENLNEYRRYKEERQDDLERMRKENDDLATDLTAARSKAKDLSYDLEDERSKVKDLTADLDEEFAKTKELTRTFWDVKDQLEERTKTSRALHSKTDELRTEIANTVRDLGTEQASWRQREHELLTKITIIEGALDSASRSQQKAEVDHDYVAKQLKDALAYKDRFDNLQQDMRTLQEELSTIRTNSTQHEDLAHRLERELDHIKGSKAADIATATARLQAEAEGARSQLEGHKTDSEARIARLQARLDTAEIDLEDHKAKYDATLAEAEETRKHALQEQAEKHEAALEEQRAGHDRHLADLRDRHTRAMHNSSDDRHRMEHHYNEKIALGEDKVQHLESKIADLEERLQISKSAAQAAVSAVMARGANLPTPANSVVASPPQRAQSASLSLMKGTDLPEKISVQGLRETIITLQEQLQESDREKERLQAEVAKVDTDMPEKIKAYETEALWLRELLGVRIDEMEEIVQSLSKPDFDREAVRDAAIRLKTHIQMEQQIRERAARNASAAGAPSLPSLSDIMGYAQSPRSVLPMVGQAAWGNLRKARDVSINAFGQLASDYAATPSKATRAASPAGSYSSSPMTPPNTVQQARRTQSNSDVSMTPPPPTMRPLAAAAAARRMNTPTIKSAGSFPEARPLRAFSSQPRALRVKPESFDGRDPLTDLNENTGPRTPTAVKGREEIDLGADIDDDASPLDASAEFPPFEDIAPKPMDA